MVNQMSNFCQLTVIIFRASFRSHYLYSWDVSLERCLLVISQMWPLVQRVNKILPPLNVQSQPFRLLFPLSSRGSFVYWGFFISLSFNHEVDWVLHYKPAVLGLNPTVSWIYQIFPMAQWLEDHAANLLIVYIWDVISFKTN